jgi:hypothetical protein
MKPSFVGPSVRMLVGAALVAAIVVTSGTASADDELPPGVIVADEGADAWLHDHCSFRGAKAYAREDVTPAGAVVTLQYTRSKGLFGSEIVVKAFRCGERPPFALMTFVPAPENEVMCVDVKTSCARPFRVASAKVAKPADATSTASKVETTAPKVEKKTAPEMPAPPPPRWAKKKAKEKVVTEAVAKAPSKKAAKARLAVAVSRDPGPGY